MPEVFQSQKTEIYLQTPESHHARQSSKTARVQVVRLVTLASLMSPTSAYFLFLVLAGCQRTDASLEERLLPSLRPTGEFAGPPQATSDS